MILKNRSTAQTGAPHRPPAIQISTTGYPSSTLHLPMWRSKLLVFFLFIAFAVMLARAFWIQGPGNAFYQKQGESRYQRTLELSATRGKIFDRNGVVLATSLPARAIWAIPEDVPDIFLASSKTFVACQASTGGDPAKSDPAMASNEANPAWSSVCAQTSQRVQTQTPSTMAARSATTATTGLVDPKIATAARSPDKLFALSQLLEMSVQELQTKLASDRSFVYLKRQVSLERAAQIAALDIPGIYQRKEYKRFYPEGEITAHLIGFTSIEDKGQEGVELGFQSQLAGVPGSRRVIKDRMGRIVEDVDELVEPRDGHDITLSVDSKIQYITYTALKKAILQNQARSGAAIVVDARTGEVLALVNYPTYNPNNRAHLTGEQLRNRILTDMFEPGSIMKPFTVALALDLHRVAPSSTVYTAPGYYMIDGAKISDVSNHGTLTVAGVIKKSSNVGISKIALQLKPEEMWNMFTSVGLGQAPKVGFPGTVAGRLRPWKSWRRIEQATMSYGYGISASLFQMAHAYTVFAHGGQLLPLTLLKHQEDSLTGTQVFSSQTAKAVSAMLESVVAPGGTAPNAQVPGYRVGGKTSTVYEHTKHGYDRKKYRASIVEMGPFPDPRFIVAVSIDRPSAGKHFGGQVAGPVSAEILSNTLRVRNIAPQKPFDICPPSGTSSTQKGSGPRSCVNPAKTAFLHPPSYKTSAAGALS